MITDAIIKLPHQIDYWDFEFTVDPITNNEIRDYFFARTINVLITESSGASTMYCKDLLSFNGQVRNALDASGNKMFNYPIGDGTEAPLYISVGDPVMNYYGSVVGYRYAITPYFDPTLVRGN